MRVAFLFAGQFRPIDRYLIDQSLSILLKDIDYSIFSFCWEETAKSLNHSNKLPKLSKVENISSTIEEYFSGYNLENYNFESFLNFKDNLNNDVKNIFYSKNFHSGTVNSIPQLYTIYKCFKLMQNSTNTFDLIFRCRYDSLFLHPLNIYPLKKIYENNKLYNLNFGRAYYPFRVYDIFFGGSYKAMSFFSDLWNDIPSLVNNKFDNGLDQRDCCRLIYLSAKNNSIKTKSFKSRICDIYRNQDNYIYEKYLIKSHLISLKISSESIKSIKFYFNWFLKQGLSNSNLFLNILFFLIKLPLSYLKRIRYLNLLINSN